MAGGNLDATGVVVKDRFRAFLSNFVEAAPPGGADASFASQSQQSQAQKVRASERAGGRAGAGGRSNARYQLRSRARSRSHSPCLSALSRRLRTLARACGVRARPSRRTR
jgi:hypothetical protein